MKKLKTIGLVKDQNLIKNWERMMNQKNNDEQMMKLKPRGPKTKVPK